MITEGDVRALINICKEHATSLSSPEARVDALNLYAKLSIELQNYLTEAAQGEEGEPTGEEEESTTEGDNTSSPQEEGDDEASRSEEEGGDGGESLREKVARAASAKNEEGEKK